jgi:hypothetical protein
MNKLSLLIIDGNNTITGTLDSLIYLPNLSLFEIGGFNTITGPVTIFMSNILNGIQRYTRFSLTPINPGGLTTTEVDYILNQFTNRYFYTSGPTRQISMLGPNDPRSSLSDTAVSYLQSIGVIVSTN